MTGRSNRGCLSISIALASLALGLVVSGPGSADEVAPDPENPWREFARKPWEDPHINEPADPRTASVINAHAARSLNPEAAKTLNPCAAQTLNPCAAKTLNACAARTLNAGAAKSLNPCAARTLNPCAARTLNACAARTLNAAAAEALNPYAARTLNASAALTLNACAAKTLNACAAKTLNPGAARTLNPCAATTLNPCAAKTLNSRAARTLNACAAKTLNPCLAKTLDPDVAASLSAAGAQEGKPAPVSLGDPGANEKERLAALNPCRAKALNPCAGKPANPGSVNVCGGPNPCGRANPCGGTNPCGGANPCAGGQPTMAPELEDLMSEFMSTAREISGRPGGERSVRFPGPPDKPNWFQALRVTHVENPLLEEQCKKEALETSVRAFGETQGLDGAAARRSAAAHMRGHQDFIKDNEISYSRYLEEIAECRAFCGPLVASLMRCQVLAVSRSPHTIVLFGLDSDELDAGDREGVVEPIRTQLEASADARVVLIGRASRVGNLLYNRRLAARRALAVRDALVAGGVDRERIHSMWFGWEPPQLSPWIADQYGLAQLYEQVGPLAINQSVMVVVY